MYYALVHYLESYSPQIDTFRQKHDSRVNVTPPHLTSVFPVDAAIGEAALVHHIENILRGWKPFDIRLEGVVRSWDAFIFLTVRLGKQSVITLHDQLYTGVLSPYLRKDIEFIPHVTIGQENGNQDVLREAKILQLSELIHISKLHLIKCADDKTPHEWERVFELG